ncbi:RICIN domain-containing protein [Kitasatospora sp. NPDC091335]|uniref:RICIN domain-containing protein n=1 Tax=Kitasatospora sp. NPDC091335 TaxID=3364085 RepID=UPI003801FC59
MESKGNVTRIAGAGAAIAFSSTLLVGGATPAHAVTYYEVANANNTSACLQVDARTDPGNVVLGSCDRSAKQVWQISGGVFKNPASGHCLDGNGADVYTHPCNGGDYQKWTTTSGSPKSIKHNKSGKYLDANGTVGAEVGFQPTISTASRWVIRTV